MIKLIGILIVVVGFALRMDSIAIVLSAGLITGVVGGLPISEILEILGSSFVANRSLAIFIVVMLVTGTLERNGLQEVAAKLIGKIKNASAGLVIGVYGFMRLILGAFNVGLGGVAGFVRPIVMPMAEGAVLAKKKSINENHLEEIKGMASGMENITWFFGQVLFVGGSGALLVQTTMRDLGYEVNLLAMAKSQIPVAITAYLLALVYYYFKDKKLEKKYYNEVKTETEER